MRRDLTLVLHTSVDRIKYMPHLLQRWKGPISMAVYVGPRDRAKAVRLLNAFGARHDLTVTFYIVATDADAGIRRPPPAANAVAGLSRGAHNCIFFGGSCQRQRNAMYPINYLRDLGIGSARTSHFVNMDMDLWPNGEKLRGPMYPTVAAYPSVAAYPTASPRPPPPRRRVAVRLVPPVPCECVARPEDGRDHPRLPVHVADPGPLRKGRPQGMHGHVRGGC